MSKAKQQDSEELDEVDEVKEKTAKVADPTDPADQPWDFRPDSRFREVPEHLVAMWKGIQSNTPVKLKKGYVVVNVPGTGQVKRTHGAFVLFNDNTRAVRISIKDMKMPNDPNLDCSHIDVHPSDVAPDFDYEWPGRVKFAPGQQGKSLELFNRNKALTEDEEIERSDEVVLAGGRPGQPMSRSAVPVTVGGRPAVGGVKMEAYNPE